MPSLALTFDPRYVTAAIDVWRARDLMLTSVPEFERETAKLMGQRFTSWNEMGMREQKVSAAAVTKAIGVFTSLKLAKKTTKGKGEARIAMLMPTLDGREILSETPIGGVLYPQFAERLSSAPSALHNLLDLLAKHGPMTQPILHPLPEAPKRGKAYQAYIEEGLSEYRRQATDLVTKPTIAYEPVNTKATPPQRVKAAQAWATQAHPAGAVKQLDKAISVGLALGLLWVDTTQVNEVIGAKSIGLAATKIATGYRPNLLSWPGDSGAFTQALISAIATRANGSGFATIQEVRGAIGRKLDLSPIAVDALLRETRDAGDRHEIRLELHFEFDEDQLYSPQRDPLIWRGETFELVTVRRAAQG